MSDLTIVWCDCNAAMTWPVGSVVVCRQKRREDGGYKYVLFEVWQGENTWGSVKDAKFLLLQGGSR